MNVAQRMSNSAKKNLHGNMQNIIALFSFATQRCAKSFRYFGRKPGETADYEKVPASCKKAENIFNTGGIGAL